MAQDKIMIVDNEMEIIQLIKLYLTREGFNVVWTTDSTKAAELARQESPDLILLDIVMPNMNGIEVCEQIRKDSDVQIVFISCKDEDMDKVLALSIGGDDYITKPFSPAELVARVKAHLRRQRVSSGDMGNDYTNGSSVQIGDISLNLLSHTAFVRDTEIHLTAKEFDLLLLFCKYPNRVFTTQQIYENLWFDCGLESDGRTVMVHISNLRKKIDAVLGSDNPIKTVRGVGYKLSAV